jgi:transposase
VDKLVWLEGRTLGAHFKKNKKNLSRVKNSRGDGVYSGENFAAAIKEILEATVKVVKRSELHKFAVIPKRWAWRDPLFG